MDPATAVPQVAVVIPSYKVKRHVMDVIARIGSEVSRIYVVDDQCPDGSGEFVEGQNTDDRVRVIFHAENQGVGGAVLSGYQAAIDEGMDIIVKIDGDGQMDPALLPQFIAPLIAGDADYAKGNRFFHLDELHQMPRTRQFGNAVLSFMSKFSTGYWSLFDPTNGYTAIQARVASHLPFDKVSRRYFFETDMLFRLNTLRALVVDIPMDANYGDEESNLKIKKILPEFLKKHISNFFRRIFYNYYLRDLSLASLELPLGIAMVLFGLVFGITHWISAVQNNIASTAGTVMLAALPLILGVQLLLAFLGADIANQPQRPIFRSLAIRKKTGLK
ncbi:glycosyltransferase family 2 protein [Ottowia sp. GY511]|uniref:Glycosyltransferase family 2 protein n=1 Tax=Ottowia flava TaxID=2675430 RepID=A0ABW4KUS2_9BURK|nr:glycosyltransferase family 2 protein [Ottowia sp. GY511]TXK33317.1 glycosyltransferase family 2 protein [Ottowia sp. GY511]